MAKSLILCDCLGSQKINAAAFDGLPGLKCSKIHSHLCTSQAEQAARLIAAAGAPGDVVIACGQEQERFLEIAAEIGAPEPAFVDLRDRAGWSEDGAKAGPKMAALVADALAGSVSLKSVDVTSEGLCLILGAAPVALAAAEQLSDFLSVTVLLSAEEQPPMDRRFDVIAGRLRRATGALGQFELEIDALRQIEPGGRGDFAYTTPRDGGQSQCDVILDLRGGQPLFPAPEKREGYLRADPGDPLAVARVVMEASHLVGIFEKPLYLTLDPELCAHSRAGQAGCSKCLDICPTGAILSAGDHVDIDPMICAGCGGCSALCPSGAIRFDDPPVSALFRRISTLAGAYRDAGGAGPRLLVHDRSFGAEMISLAARYERGLPADVIPMDLGRVSGFGHAEMLAALASGFAAVDILMSPSTERDALDRELALARALAGDKAALRLIEPGAPEGLCEMLYDAAKGPVLAEPVLAMGNRRQVSRLAVRALRGDTLSVPLALPADAPYGAVLVDTEACTLCLSCVSLCPSGALGDNPDMPQLRFQEDACLQCGLCAHACPEKAITLEPRFDASDAALSQRVLHEEEPFACIECGKLFGVKSTIEKIVEKLEGKHAMFATSDATRMIRMCDDCRVNAQFHATDNPFQGGERPKPRTTDDYLSKRRDH